MNTLKQIIASSVIDAFRAREYVLVADTTVELLGEELQTVLSATLSSIMHHLHDERGRGQPARHVRQGSLGHGEVEDAVSDMVELAVEQVLGSDHVDDIYAEDRVLRRHARRAIHQTLLDYVRGEIDASSPDGVTLLDVELSHLGYVVDVVAGLLRPRRLERSLRAVAKAFGGRLISLDAPRKLTLFELPEGTERLTFEEAITAAMGELVAEEVVELPSVEQILELTEGTSAATGFVDAVARVEAAALTELGSRATCRLLDEQTIVVTLTPLSDDSADNAANLFEQLLGMLEHELVSLLPAPIPEEPRSRPRRRRGEAPASEGKAPKSQQRRARRSAARAAEPESATRERQKRQQPRRRKRKA